MFFESVDMSREQWSVRNTTTKEVSIGDLFRVPSLPAGKTIDLLKFHNTEELHQSSNLHHLLNLGWLTLVKTAAIKNPIPHNTEEDELNWQTDLHTTTITSDYTISTAIRTRELIRADAANNNIVVNVPRAATNANHIIYVKKVDTSFHVVRVVGAIDGKTFKLITEPFDTMEIAPVGTGWDIV